MLIILQSLYRHSLILGYVPKIWRGVLVTFLSKPGKDDYSKAGAYRPISLMSFILKGLEKLIDRVIRQEDLMVNKLMPEQHAYQKGKGTESAIHHLVNYIEKSTLNKKVNLTVFIDISGAFDNTATETIIEHSKEKGIKEWIIKWMIMMLKNRRVKASSKSCDKRFKPNRGCPQGGVLSPLMWSLVVDSLIKRLKKAGLHVTAYTDDLAISTMGNYASICCQKINKALKIVETWCNETGLYVNPEKTELVRFTKRTKKDLKMCKIKLFGEELKLTRSVKYLGIYLDTKLSMLEHINQTYKKGIKSLWATKSMIAKTWGLSPKMMLWVYKQIIIPRITYGSLTTWKAINDKKSYFNMLNKIQRMALLMVTGAMRTTPTTALEVITNTIPIDVKVKSNAILAYKRLKYAGTWREDSIPKGQASIVKIANKILRDNDEDNLNKTWFVGKHFKTICDSSKNWDNKNKYILNPLKIWTDASVYDAKSGIGIYSSELSISKSLRLNDKSTITQAEIKAIELAAEILIKRDIKKSNILIYTDSKRSISTLDRGYTNTKTALECIKKLNELRKSNNLVKVCWVPKEIHALGNTIADKLARGATEKDKIDEIIPLNEKSFTESMKAWETKTANKKLEKTKKGSIFELFLKKFDNNRFNFINRVGKENIRIITGILTGHCGLREHLHKMKLIDEKVCRLCHNANENIIHFLRECDDTEIRQIRERIFLTCELQNENLGIIDPTKLMKFVKDTGMFKCFIIEN